MNFDSKTIYIHWAAYGTEQHTVEARGPFRELRVWWERRRFDRACRDLRWPHGPPLAGVFTESRLTKKRT